MKFFTLTLLFWMAMPVLSEPVDIEIDRTAERFNLGLSDFVSKSRKLTPAQMATLQSTVEQDLAFSRVFNLVKKGPLVKSKRDATEWAPLGSKAVLSATVRIKSGTKVVVDAKLYEVVQGKVLYETKQQSDESVRDLAHQIANDVVQYFTGLPGIFTSKITFVNDNTGRKELYVASYDARETRRLTNDNSIVILPRISPDGSKIIFTSYRRGNPDLYIINTDGTGRQRISKQSGLNVSPSWDPSGEQLAVTLSKDGPPNIYLMNLQGRVLRRLTDSQGADTAPSFSPDGNQIAFTSDRAGSPHIYVINVDGTELRRLTTEGHCDSAAWSPDGNTLVYVKGKGRARFDIYSIEVLTGVERRLTWGEGDNENPVWSPDSKSILFVSNRGGKSELYTMSADGTEQKRLRKLKGQTFTPHW